jgi:hypothetical protein
MATIAPVRTSFPRYEHVYLTGVSYAVGEQSLALPMVSVQKLVEHLNRSSLNRRKPREQREIIRA